MQDEVERDILLGLVWRSGTRERFAVGRKAHAFRYKPDEDSALHLQWMLAS
jgi:hypothetical protein